MRPNPNDATFMTTASHFHDLKPLPNQTTNFGPFQQQKMRNYLGLQTEETTKKVRNYRELKDSLRVTVRKNSLTQNQIRETQDGAGFIVPPSPTKVTSPSSTCGSELKQQSSVLSARESRDSKQRAQTTTDRRMRLSRFEKNPMLQTSYHQQFSVAEQGQEEISIDQ